MGGQALKNTYTERKNTEEFNFIKAKIIPSIIDILQYEAHVVKFYHNKETHGDMDILIKINNHTNNKLIINFIKNNYNPNEIHMNGNVISFNYEDFQIDFILINESNWDIAKHYFDYDCCGNIMGKTYHKFNLSYGWEGMYYKFRNFNGRNSSNILISKDPRKIFDFGGYNYDKYLLGFDNLEEIFAFVIDCKYFDSNIFQMENLKHIDRKRNRKRKSYHVFLNYLKENGIATQFSFNRDKAMYIPIINEFFPEADLIEKLDLLNEKNNINKILAEKFNGNIIMTWTNLSGKELGNAIRKFKLALGDKYNDFILNNNENTIREYFIKTNSDD